MLDIQEDIEEPSPLFLLEMLAASRCSSVRPESIKDLLEFSRFLPSLTSIVQLTNRT